MMLLISVAVADAIAAAVDVGVATRCFSFVSLMVRCY